MTSTWNRTRVTRMVASGLPTMLQPPKKPLFYRRFVDDFINRRKKNERSTIFENLNSTSKNKLNHRSESLQFSWYPDYPPTFLNSVIHQLFTPENTTHLLFHLIFFKRVNHLYWLKYHTVKKTKMFPNILLRNSRHLSIDLTELQ